jgi:hypothetical protein
MSYPIIKIPDLIKNTKQQKIRTTSKKEIYIETVNKHDLFLLTSMRNSGYTLLFLGALIFCFSLAGNLQWLPLGVLISLLGSISANWRHIQPQLLIPQKIKSVQNIVETKLVPIDWENVLTDNTVECIDKPTAQVGVSEGHFRKYLKQYFPDILRPSYTFKLNDSYAYSSDFTIILPNKFSIIVELDEPYEGRSKKPYHCTDTKKDLDRDEFFVNREWIVIRFSEYQTCAYPIECCYEIAILIDRFNSSTSYSNKFVNISRLALDPQWDTKKAVAMARKDYRLQYLTKYNIYQDK